MHILNEPSFFLTNKTRASQGEELGLMKPLSESSCSCFDNSFISDGAKRYGAQAIVSYYAAFVTLQSTRARVIALALGALRRISLI
nr:hypothetical protein [Tanacetum cinerariifolium]